MGRWWGGVYLLGSIFVLMLTLLGVFLVIEWQYEQDHPRQCSCEMVKNRECVP